MTSGAAGIARDVEGFSETRRSIRGMHLDPHEDGDASTTRRSRRIVASR